MNLASFVVSLVRPVTRETVLEDARVYAQSRLQNRPGIIGAVSPDELADIARTTVDETVGRPGNIEDRE